jgi:hypothetical protein
VPPKASFDVVPAAPSVGEAVQFSSASNGSIATYDWDLNGDAAGGAATGPAPSFAYPTAGTYAVRLTVTDARGTADTTTRLLTVVKPPPYAVTDTAPTTGEHVTFDATRLGTGPRGVKEYRWDLNGDGIFERNTRQAPAVGLTYGKPGTYQTALVVIHGDGSRAQFGGTVTVAPGRPGPRGCGVYCAVDFPFHATGETGTGGGGCETSLEFGLIVAEADCLRPAAGGTFTSSGRVRVNGLDVIPTFGTLITLDPERFTITSPSPASVQFGELPLALIPINWTGLDGTGGEAVTPNYLAPPGSNLVEGFPQAGRQQITFRSHTAVFNTEA